MNTPVLCVIQARYASTRLPGKMLLDLGGETLVARGYRIASVAFGRENVVVAIPAGDGAGPLGDELRRIGATVFAWEGDERDVLGRFFACAVAYRTDPESKIFRFTADDPWKSPEIMRRVAAGERHPVEVAGEAWTLAELEDIEAFTRIGEPLGSHVYQQYRRDCREHITLAFCSKYGPSALPLRAPPGCYTIDTEADYAEAQRLIASGERV